MECGIMSGGVAVLEDMMLLDRCPMAMTVDVSLAVSAESASPAVP